MRLFLLLIPAFLAAVETGPLQVHRVIDGDTIEVVADLGGVPMVVPVRILWIDAPESRGSRAMPEGQEATEALTALIGDLPVALYVEGDAFERDRYGRLLANAYLTEPNIDVGSEMVRTGHAVYWRRYGEPNGMARVGGAEPIFTHMMMLEVAQAEAQMGHDGPRGVWGTAREWAEARADERPED